LGFFKTKIDFKKYLKSVFILLFLSRFNKTLKLKLARFMTHGKKARWCDVLQDVVTSYNNTYHRSIKMKPTDVKPGLTESLAWRNQYETQTPPAEQGHYRFKTGDMVRVSHLARAFKREYDQRWSTEVFRVQGRQRRGAFNVYTLQDLQEETVLGTWYEKELQGVTVDLSGSFTVQEVLRSRKVRGKKQYLVSWVGYPSKFNSWISDDDFTPLEGK
jgi:hypothetical protein